MFQKNYSVIQQHIWRHWVALDSPKKLPLALWLVARSGGWRVQRGIMWAINIEWSILPTKKKWPRADLWHVWPCECKRCFFEISSTSFEHHNFQLTLSDADVLFDISTHAIYYIQILSVWLFTVELEQSFCVKYYIEEYFFLLTPYPLLCTS